MPRAPGIASHLAAIPEAVYSSIAERLERNAGESLPFSVGGSWQAIIGSSRKGPDSVPGSVGEVGSVDQKIPSIPF